jgi:hypothetical protein
MLPALRHCYDHLVIAVGRKDRWRYYEGGAAKFSSVQRCLLKDVSICYPSPYYQLPLAGTENKLPHIFQLDFYPTYLATEFRSKHRGTNRAAVVAGQIRECIVIWQVAIKDFATNMASYFSGWRYSGIFENRGNHIEKNDILSVYEPSPMEIVGERYKCALHASQRLYVYRIGTQQRYPSKEGDPAIEDDRPHSYAFKSYFYLIPICLLLTLTYKLIEYAIWNIHYGPQDWRADVALIAAWPVMVVILYLFAWGVLGLSV